MGYYVMKPDPSEDFYVEWSTYTDTPIAYGPKQEFQDYDPEIYNDTRFERIDETGTSAYLRDGGYEENSFWLGQSWEIPRQNLKPFVIETFPVTGFDICNTDEDSLALLNKYCTPLIFED